MKKSGLKSIFLSIVLVITCSFPVFADIDLSVSEVRKPFKVVNTPETDKEYRERLNRIAEIGKKYDVALNDPLIFTGKEKKALESSKQLTTGTALIYRKKSPSYFDVVYKVNSKEFNDHSYIRINKKTADYIIYELSSQEVKPLSRFKKPENRILHNNINDKNKEYRDLLVIFANRLIKRGICNSVKSGARYTSNSATLTCGDGMEYTQTLRQIRDDAQIEQRVIKSYAVF